MEIIKNSFGPYDRFVEWLPTELMMKFREYDREQGDADYLDGLTEQIKQEGFKEPLILSYSRSTRTALLTEGNHRLAVAVRLGWTEVPVRVYRREGAFNRGAGVSVPGFDETPHWNEDYKREVTPHVPADMKPSDIGVGSSTKTAKLVYHGTPHEFDSFSTDSIGSGEGNQSFGWGLYFTDTKQIAELYRDILTHYKAEAVVKSLIQSGISQETAEAFAEYYAQVGRGGAMGVMPFTSFAEAMNQPAPYPPTEAMRERMRRELPKLKEAIRQIKGKLYAADIPEDDVMLLWDKPLSEQPPKVQQALQPDPEVLAEYERLNREADKHERNSPEWNELINRAIVIRKKHPMIAVESYNPTEGQSLYRSLSTLLGTDKRASKCLEKAGIKGIKYLDGGSRNEGTGTYNYVIFDDRDVTNVKVGAATPNPTRIGAAVKQFCASNESYAILDSLITGGTWLAGGCWILAYALCEGFGGELYGVFAHGIPQHAVAKIGNQFIDGDGASTAAQLLHRWKSVERLPADTYLAPVNPTEVFAADKEMVAPPEEGRKDIIEGIKKILGAKTAKQVFHGTPHEFDSFSIDNIGTGEGNQLFGWGLYFTDTKQIAERYRDILTHYKAEAVVKSLIQSGISQETAEAFAEYYAQVGRGGAMGVMPFTSFAEAMNQPAPYPPTEAMRERMRRELPKLKEAIRQIKGKLYAADIPEDDVMLLWDKPLSEQPPKVQQALQPNPEVLAEYERLNSEADKQERNSPEWNNLINRAIAIRKKHPMIAVESYNPTDGQSLYRSLSTLLGTDKRASKCLEKVGIKGIKYLDGNSRNEGSGTYNYVVFDDRDVKNVKISAAPPLAQQGITQTPQFKAWFSGSEVVDKQGNPLVMYHATQSDIGEFHAYTHFGTQGAANDRHQNLWDFYNDELKNPTRAQGSNIMPVYLSVKNPLRMVDLASIDDNTGSPIEDFDEAEEMEEEERPYPRGWEGDEAIPMTLYEMGIMDIDEFEEHRSNDKALQFLAAQGYDGIVYENVVEDPGNDSWIVFNPNQIKSAVGNTTFDPNSKSITANDYDPDAEYGEQSNGWALNPDQREDNQTNNIGVLDAAIVASTHPVKYSYGLVEVVAPESIVGVIPFDEEDLMAKGVETEPHLTAKYGILNNKIDGIRELATQYKPFKITLGKTSTFPPSKSSDNAVPVIIEVTSPELHELNAKLGGVADFKPSDFDDYRPHLTLAYVRPEAAEKYTGIDTLEGMEFEVTELVVSDPDDNKTVFPLKVAETTDITASVERPRNEDMEDYVLAYLRQYPKGEPGVSDGLSRPDGSGEIVYRGHDGRVLGVMAYSPTEITDIAVHKDHRTRGIGTTMMEELRKRGISKFRPPMTEAGEAFAKKQAFASDHLPNFDTWIKSHGGIEELVSDYDWNIGEWFDVDENLSDEEKEKEYLRIAEAYLCDKFHEFLGEHDYRGSEFDIYRTISADDLKSIKFQGLGIYWSWDAHAAEAHWGHGGSCYTFRARVKEMDVNWDMTIFNNLYPSLGDEEKEVQLNPGVPIQLTGWVEGRAYDNSKWMKPYKGWKDVTASTDTEYFQQAKEELAPGKSFAD